MKTPQKGKAAPDPALVIEAAFRALPISQDGAGLPCESLIPYAVADLISVAVEVPRELSQAAAENPLPRDFTARDELMRLANDAARLLDHMRVLHAPARNALVSQLEVSGLSKMSFLDLGVKLAVLEEAARVAKPKQGAPEKKTAARVAAKAAEYYEFLTGEKPKIPGRNSDAQADRPNAFVNFLQEVYATLGIQASSSSQTTGALSPRRGARGAQLNKGKKTPI